MWRDLARFGEQQDFTVTRGTSEEKKFSGPRWSAEKIQHSTCLGRCPTAASSTSTSRAEWRIGLSERYASPAVVRRNAVQKASASEGPIIHAENCADRRC